MKVPPKRKGNSGGMGGGGFMQLRLNESPSEKEGKCLVFGVTVSAPIDASMKVPPKRKGNHAETIAYHLDVTASMKVPPKRKGNGNPSVSMWIFESAPSMKVPPKRKGNLAEHPMDEHLENPQ